MGRGAAIDVGTTAGDGVGHKPPGSEPAAPKGATPGDGMGAIGNPALPPPTPAPHCGTCGGKQPTAAGGYPYPNCGPTPATAPPAKPGRGANGPGAGGVGNASQINGASRPASPPPELCRDRELGRPLILPLLPLPARAAAGTGAAAKDAKGSKSSSAAAVDDAVVVDRPEDAEGANAPLLPPDDSFGTDEERARGAGGAKRFSCGVEFPVPAPGGLTPDDDAKRMGV